MDDKGRADNTTWICRVWVWDFYASIDGLVDYFQDNFKVENICVNFFPR